MSRFRKPILSAALLAMVAGPLAVADEAPPKVETPAPAPAKPAKPAKPMKMNEPMSGEMKKEGMTKGDVRKAAEKKDRDMKEPMEKEEKEMKKGR